MNENEFSNVTQGEGGIGQRLHAEISAALLIIAVTAIACLILWWLA